MKGNLSKLKEERLLGLDIDPTLSWSNHVTNLRKKLLKRVAVLARIKKFLPTKYRIILFKMLVSNLFLSIVYQFGQVVMLDCWMKFLKFKNDVRVLSSMLPSRLERYRYFINFDGCLLTIFVLKDV